MEGGGILTPVAGYLIDHYGFAVSFTHTSPHNRSTILGLYFFGSMEGGGILTPIAGYLIDHYGFAVSFTISGALLLAVTFICSFLLRGSRD